MIADLRDDVSGSIRCYLYDGLGSVLGEMDPNGTITSSRKYDVYGSVRGGVNPAGTSKHKFVGALGHPSEDETGLIYMRARYYDPVVGRFASEDVARDGRNWFTYVGANPTSRVDRSGKNWSLAGVMTALGDYLNAETGEDSQDLKLLADLRDKIEALRSGQFSEKTWEIAKICERMLEDVGEHGMKAMFATAGVSLNNPVTLAHSRDVLYDLYLYTYDGIMI